MPSSTTRRIILDVLNDGMPHTTREVVAKGLGEKAAYQGLFRCWASGLILRTKKPIVECEKVFKGRLGNRRHTRPYHLYMLKPAGRDRVMVNGLEFVSYSKEHLDVRGGGSFSKAKMILNFLKENSGQAWFSKEIVDALRDKGVKSHDVMSAIRRFERKGLVYVRGYHSELGKKPFAQGFLSVWLDPSKPRHIALDEAIRLTNLALERKGCKIPIIQRVQRLRDIVYEALRLGEIVSLTYIQSVMNCTDDELDGCVRRAMQLYPEIKEVKLFDAYRYLYHASMHEDVLRAAIEMKENYIRVTQGRMNRVRHNWEACVEWFIDRFTSGAEFLTQQHRSVMDPRRITIHLIKPVRGRRSNAEVDRVWTVKPNPFAQPITYVLECKWGLVNKMDVDEFFDVLKWSMEFGCDTPEGRQLKQGVIGIFAGSAFNPRERVQIRDGASISLASYAGRLNIQILRAADFNQKLRERGIQNAITVQKICKVARNEGEVRTLLDAIWSRPEEAESLIAEAIRRNGDVYVFERQLETGARTRVELPVPSVASSSPSPS